MLPKQFLRGPPEMIVLGGKMQHFVTSVANVDRAILGDR